MAPWTEASSSASAYTRAGTTTRPLRRIWQDADRLGYYSATLYDLLNAPTLECWTTLAALAAETGRVRLTPLVLANTYRHPSVFAKMASTLDVISNGRLEVGIGAGGSRGDHAASGLEFPSTPVRVRMLEESVEMMKRLWTEDEVAFEGSYYTLNGAEERPQACPEAPSAVPNWRTRRAASVPGGRQTRRHLQRRLRDESRRAPGQPGRIARALPERGPRPCGD